MKSNKLVAQAWKAVRLVAGVLLYIALFAVLSTAVVYNVKHVKTAPQFKTYTKYRTC